MINIRRLFAVLSLALLSIGALLYVLVIRDNGTANNEVSWLYSQTSDSAELDDLGAGNYRLIMRGVDLHTIQFSDRPDRLVDIIKTSNIVDAWDTYFETSAPNAVLVEHEPTGESDSLVVVLERPRYDIAAAELSYDITILTDEEHPERLKKLANSYAKAPVSMKAVSLFIDSVTTSDASPSPIFSGPGAQELKSRLGLSDIPMTPFDIGTGVRIMSAVSNVGVNGEIATQAVIGFAQNSFTVNMDMKVTDLDNWNLTAISNSQESWSTTRVPGLTIDPSKFSGTISKTRGSLDFNLKGGQHTWQVANNATYVSQLGFSNTCPLASNRCPSDIGSPFISMNGTLNISSVPNPITMSGAMTTNAEWARFDGLAGNFTYEGTGISNTTLTMWRGARNDQFDPNMELPSLGALTNGNNLEFCGRLSVNIPKIGNAATDGCLRWSPVGGVLAQVGVNSTINGTLPSTGVDGSASANVAGVALTNLSEQSLSQLPSTKVVMSGVDVELQPNATVLAGRASLPGVLANALNINLNVSRLSVDIRGVVSPTELSLSGAIETNIKIGAEPFLLDVKSMMLSIDAQAGNGFSFGVGTKGDATFGYSPNARKLTTSLQIVAATRPALGMLLSVDVRGTPASQDANKDGLTVASKLTSPSKAQYVWPDQFGIKGLNLWNLTVQIAYADGLPSLGYSSTSYVNPVGTQTKNVISCKDTCDEKDWLIGTLGLNISLTNPCLAYSIESTSGESGLAIDGGLLRASRFKIGAAPTGCAIQSGSTQLSLPVGFFGFQFSAEFGDTPRTTIDVGTKVSVNGFVFKGEITQLKLAGLLYKDLSLNINITDTSSEVDFTSSMTSGIGDMDISTSFAANSTGFKQSLSASMTNWKMKKTGTVDLKEFTFATSADIPTQGGCAQFKASARGSLKVGSRDFVLEGATIDLQCNKVNQLYLKVDYTHKVKWNGVMAKSSLELKYPDNPPFTKHLSGTVRFSYTRDFSAKYEGRTFSREVNVDFLMSIRVDPQNPDYFGFSFDGAFEADRASGDIGCSMDSRASDFSCSGQLRLNPSWAGIYHFDWDGL